MDNTEGKQPDEEEIVAIEIDGEGKPIPPEGEADAAPAAKPAEDGGADDDGDDDGEGGDKRLAVSEEDSDEEVSLARKRRQQRKERRKRAENMSKAELEQLRSHSAALEARLAAMEGHQIVQTGQTLQQRYAQKQNEIAHAEHVIVEATKVGAGEDVMAATRIREQAIAEANAIARQIQQVTEFSQQPRPNGSAPAQQQTAQPAVDPRVISYANQWAEANPWYDPKGRDEDSQLVLEIDKELAAEGFDPKTREYWAELTKRAAEELDDKTGSSAQGKPRRTGPPVGGSREHAPSTTRKEIRVTPERKAAMIEAGAWDDPVKRQRMLKAYRDYDNQQSAR